MITKSIGLILGFRYLIKLFRSSDRCDVEMYETVLRKMFLDCIDPRYTDDMDLPQKSKIQASTLNITLVTFMCISRLTNKT